MTNVASTGQDGAVQLQRVLVVDDEYGPRESIAYTLATSFSVETADRAAEALKKIRDQHYHVVVLDIRMPEMDGIRALEELRKIDPHVSVIILTGYGMLSTAQQAMVAGANQYMRKPPDVGELIDAVRHQAEAAQLRRQQAKMSTDAIALSAALKREIEANQPQIWQARASVELVHDLNNPLTVVIGYSGLMLEESHKLAQLSPELGKKMADYAVVVEKAAEYCHHLSENWRMASKKVPEFSLLDLVAVAHEVRQVIFFGTTVVQIAGAPEAWIRGSKFDLMRVFQNLLKNSIEIGRLARRRGNLERGREKHRRHHGQRSRDGRGPDPPRHARGLYEQGERDGARPEHLPPPHRLARRRVCHRIEAGRGDDGAPVVSRPDQEVTDPATRYRAWATPH